MRVDLGRARVRCELSYVHLRGLQLISDKIRTHLEYLHLQILSIVTAAQLRRIFERRTNFDLRRLLNGKIVHSV